MERTFPVAQSTKQRFFDMVCALATGERLEVIEVADLKERLRDAAYQADDRKMLDYLILIGICKK